MVAIFTMGDRRERRGEVLKCMVPRRRSLRLRVVQGPIHHENDAGAKDTIKMEGTVSMRR